MTTVLCPSCGATLELVRRGERLIGFCGCGGMKRAVISVKVAPADQAEDAGKMPANPVVEDAGKMSADQDSF